MAADWAIMLEACFRHDEAPAPLRRALAGRTRRVRIAVRETMPPSSFQLQPPDPLDETAWKVPWRLLGLVNPGARQRLQIR